ncbi:MAG TPA: zf-HC2 domain-containing protein [Caulifigura sp.]|nr:zf-HC2 domain-containing protein [Caulifigura sp.]
MNCREAQRELALHAGEDLGDPDREAEVQQHLATCPSCRRRHAGVKTALAALAVPDSPGTFESVHSLWPALRRRIARGDVSSSAGWTWQTAGPIAAGLVVCAGLMVSTAALLRQPVVSDTPPVSTPAYDYGYTPAGSAAMVKPASVKRKAAPEDNSVKGVLNRRLAMPEQ